MAAEIQRADTSYWALLGADTSYHALGAKPPRILVSNTMPLIMMVMGQLYYNDDGAWCCMVHGDGALCCIHFPFPSPTCYDWNFNLLMMVDSRNFELLLEKENKKIGSEEQTFGSDASVKLLGLI